jgi:hypothetical protein
MYFVTHFAICFIVYLKKIIIAHDQLVIILFLYVLHEYRVHRNWHIRLNIILFVVENL